MNNIKIYDKLNINAPETLYNKINIYEFENVYDNYEFKDVYKRLKDVYAEFKEL